MPWFIADLVLSVGGMFSRDGNVRRHAWLGCATTLGIFVAVAIVMAVLLALRP